MATLDMGKFLDRQRHEVLSALEEASTEDVDLLMGAFDRATAKTVVGLIDGQSADTAKTKQPRKPRGPNKKKNTGEDSGTGSET